MKVKCTRGVEIGLSAHLFLRFLLCYTAVLAVGLFFHARGFTWTVSLPFTATTAIFVFLALIGGFLSISAPYLLVLTALKALVDLRTLRRLLLLASAREITPLRMNACLFLLFAALLIFAAAASAACRFAHEIYIRDLRLLLSKNCLSYLAKGICLAASGMLCHRLLSHLLQALPA